MRFSLLALAVVLTACGGGDAPIVAGETDTSELSLEPVEADQPTDASLAAGTGDAAADADGPAADGDAVGDSEIDPSDAVDDGVNLSPWVGDYPVTDNGIHFVSVPPVREKLEEAFGVEPGLLDKLSNLDADPYFLITPIERAGSMLAMTFIANGRFNPDDQMLHLLVADDASVVFALLTSESKNSVSYRASYDASAADLSPAAAAWMSQKAGVDFAEMVRTEDATELGP